MSAETAPTDAELVDGLVRTLAHACRDLARAGQPHRAGVLAAQAWALVRRTRPDLALRLDGTMHHVARLDAGDSPQDGDLP